MELQKFLKWALIESTVQIRLKWQKVIQTGRKHWEKEKLLIMSNISFSHVFKRPLLQTCENQERVKLNLVFLSLEKEHSFFV